MYGQHLEFGIVLWEKNTTSMSCYYSFIRHKFTCLFADALI